MRIRLQTWYDVILYGDRRNTGNRQQTTTRTQSTMISIKQRWSSSPVMPAFRTATVSNRFLSTSTRTRPRFISPISQPVRISVPYLNVNNTLLRCSRSFTATTTSGQKYPLMSSTSFYDLKADLPGGQTYDFSQLKGKVVLIVNVASQWWALSPGHSRSVCSRYCSGFTPQYTGTHFDCRRWNLLSPFHFVTDFRTSKSLR